MLHYWTSKVDMDHVGVCRLDVGLVKTPQHKLYVYLTYQYAKKANVTVVKWLNSKHTCKIHWVIG